VRVGLGVNAAQPRENCNEAWKLVANLAQVMIVAREETYRTIPDHQEPLS